MIADGCIEDAKREDAKVSHYLYLLNSRHLPLSGLPTIQSRKFIVALGLGLGLELGLGLGFEFDFNFRNFRL